MGRLSWFIIVFILVLSSGLVFAAVFNLKLPYTKGEKWTITRGYGINTTHKESDLYALDFGLPYGHTVLAAADGKILFADLDNKKNSRAGYGNLVKEEIEGGLIVRYGHLSRLLVAKDEIVKQGQPIGEVGNTGKVEPKRTPENPQAGKHLHFAMYQVDEKGKKIAVKPEPMSGYGEGQPKGPFVAGEWYASDNELFKPNKVLNGPPAAAQPTSRPSFVIRVISWVGEVAAA